MRRTRRRLDLWHDLAEASQPRFPPPLCKSRRSWVVSNYFSFVSTRSRCWVLLQNPPVSIDSPFSFSYFLFFFISPSNVCFLFLFCFSCFCVAWRARDYSFTLLRLLWRGVVLAKSSPLFGPARSINSPHLSLIAFPLLPFFLSF